MSEEKKPEEKKPKTGPGSRKGKRYSHKIARERLDIVDQMLRQCWTHSAIQSVLAKKWDIGKRQVRNYIKKAYERWDEDARVTLVDRTALRRAQLEGVLELAMQAVPPDLKTAVSALDRLCRVDAAYAPEKAEVSHSGSVDQKVRHMTSDEQRKELQDLLSRYEQGRAMVTELSGANGKGNGRLPN
jgi:hypothetical protein